MDFATLIRPVAAPLRLAAGWALPPRCPGCGVPVAEDHRFCASCWAGLRFLGPPWCAGCCLPMPYGFGEARCARCLAQPPRHAGVRAAVAYGPVARDLALKLKYGQRLGLAETMARPMARLLPEGAELLLPVPLHRWRLWRRGFNQAALIAARVSALTGVPADPRLLVRRRATSILRGMGPAQRRRAVRGAFAVEDRAAVKDRAVVLVDDVHTSGATGDACTAVLLAAGARSVTILCWARVLGDDAAD
jgi:ComF family protein